MYLEWHEKPVLDKASYGSLVFLCEQVSLAACFALFHSYGYLVLALYPYKVQSVPLISHSFMH